MFLVVLFRARSTEKVLSVKSQKLRLFYYHYDADLYERICAQ